MGIEQKLTKRKVVVSRTPPSEVTEQINKGKAFIVVEDSFDKNSTPIGYSLVRMKYDGDTLSTLVPKNAFTFLANPAGIGGGGALDDLADFYNDAKEFEGGEIETGGTSVQVSQWATMARESYNIYIVNQLMGIAQAGDGDSIPDFDEKEIERLGLNDDYVADRVKLLAAIALGKEKQDLKEFAPEDVLAHYSSSGIAAGESVKLSNAEFRKITEMRYVRGWDDHTKHMRCLGDSHYYLKDEFKNDPDWDYDFSGDVMIKTRKTPSLDTEQIRTIENDIMQHREAKGHDIQRHDAQLLRGYANIRYIAAENRNAQLDISPPTQPPGNSE